MRRSVAKQKDEKTNVMRILDQKEIPYTPHTYPHEEGEAVDGVTVARDHGPGSGVCVQNSGGPGGVWRAVCL